LKKHAIKKKGEGSRIYPTAAGNLEMKNGTLMDIR